uniref:alpha/beta hydrolase n=1 Tax=Streptomyces polyasparticus TaxID=2767826 RepID=UPI001BE43AC5|nr:alpha/beta hydrolase [Streptomyces polyasparticus]
MVQSASAFGARGQSLVDGPVTTATYSPCRSLRIRSTLPRCTGPWNKGSARIVLLNETHDQNTTYQWAAVRMQKLLGARSRLVPVDGFGHGVPTW